MKTSNKLKAPLSFQGGKQRVAEKIIDIIGVDDNTEFVDFCCGSGSVSIAAINTGVIASNVTMIDNSEWGGFWNQVSNGDFDKTLFGSFIQQIPKNPDKIQDYLKSLKNDDYSVWEQSELIPLWLILQAGSFGGKHIWLREGKWKNASFRNYWKPTPTSSRRSPVNPMMPMPNTLHKNVLNVVDNLSPVRATRCNVVDFDFHYYNNNVRKAERVVMFLDPPYKGTTGYGSDLDYITWIQSIPRYEGYELWVTEYVPLSEEYYYLSTTNKGGISGNTKKNNTEILSRIF